MSGSRQIMLLVYLTVLFLAQQNGVRSYLIIDTASHKHIKRVLFTGTDGIPETNIGTKISKFTSTIVDGIAIGDGFKLAFTDALASLSDPFDADKLLKENLDLAASHPCMMFSWTNSPACKKAKKLLTMAGVEPYVLELDQPWSTGNAIRAVLGRHLGRTSVPMIFIGGQYIGGCDDGPTEEAPGLVPLSFMGRLQSMLSSAESLKKQTAASRKGDIAEDEVVGTCNNPFDGNTVDSTTTSDQSG